MQKFVSSILLLLQFSWHFQSTGSFPISQDHRIRLSPRSQNEYCGCAHDDPLLSSLQSRIVGGSDSEPNAFPWQLMIHFVVTNERCGGVLLNKRFGITAMHCFRSVRDLNHLGDTVWVSAGLHDFCEAELNKNAQDRFVKTVYPPDNYNQTTLEADYVVIEFDEDFELDPTHVMPACMPSGPPGAGDIGTVSGWGKQNEDGRTSCLLQYVEVPILPHEQCDKSKLGKFFNKIFNVPFPKNRICAGSLEGEMDACQGDSGGPLVKVNPANHKVELVGIVSSGIGCGRPLAPGMYTDIYFFHDKIKSLIASGECQVPGTTPSTQQVKAPPSNPPSLCLICCSLALNSDQCSKCTPTCTDHSTTTASAPPTGTSSSTATTTLTPTSAQTSTTTAVATSTIPNGTSSTSTKIAIAPPSSMTTTSTQQVKATNSIPSSSCQICCSLALNSDQCSKCTPTCTDHSTTTASAPPTGTSSSTATTTLIPTSAQTTTTTTFATSTVPTGPSSASTKIAIAPPSSITTTWNSPTPSTAKETDVTATITMTSYPPVKTNGQYSTSVMPITNVSLAIPLPSALISIPPGTQQTNETTANNRPTPPLVPFSTGNYISQNTTETTQPTITTPNHFTYAPSPASNNYYMSYA